MTTPITIQQFVALDIWQQIYHWVFLLTPSQADPLSHQFKYENPECDIVQSAAASNVVATTASMMDNINRYAPIDPRRRRLQIGSMLVPTCRKMFLTQAADRTMNELGFEDGEVLHVTKIVRTINSPQLFFDCQGKDGQVRERIPIDWEMFRHV